MLFLEHSEKKMPWLPELHFNNPWEQVGSFWKQCDYGHSEFTNAGAKKTNFWEEDFPLVIKLTMKKLDKIISSNSMQITEQKFFVQKWISVNWMNL